MKWTSLLVLWHWLLFSSLLLRSGEGQYPTFLDGQGRKNTESFYSLRRCHHQLFSVSPSGLEGLLAGCPADLYENPYWLVFGACRGSRCENIFIGATVPSLWLTKTLDTITEQLDVAHWYHTEYAIGFSPNDTVNTDTYNGCDNYYPEASNRLCFVLNGPGGRVGNISNLEDTQEWYRAVWYRRVDGAQIRIHRNMLTTGLGYTLCYEAPYSHVSTLSGIRGECPEDLLSNGPYVIAMAARESSSDLLSPVGFLPRFVLTSRTYGYTTVRSYQNKTAIYWYNRIDDNEPMIGFSSDSNMYLWGCDSCTGCTSYNNNPQTHLCWYMNGWTSGYRAGATLTQSDNYYKLFFYREKFSTWGPTPSPTHNPTYQPTYNPTKIPTTPSPTKLPTTKGPSKAPTTKKPSRHPTFRPSASPVAQPTDSPSRAPVPAPTAAPTNHWDDPYTILVSIFIYGPYTESQLVSYQSTIRTVITSAYEALSIWSDPDDFRVRLFSIGKTTMSSTQKDPNLQARRMPDDDLANKPQGVHVYYAVFTSDSTAETQLEGVTRDSNDGSLEVENSFTDWLSAAFTDTLGTTIEIYLGSVNGQKTYKTSTPTTSPTTPKPTPSEDKEQNTGSSSSELSPYILIGAIVGGLLSILLVIGIFFRYKRLRLERETELMSKGTGDYKKQTSLSPKTTDGEGKADFTTGQETEKEKPKTSSGDSVTTQLQQTSLVNTNAQAAPMNPMGMNSMGMNSMGMNSMGMNPMGMNPMGYSAMPNMVQNQMLQQQMLQQQMLQQQMLQQQMLQQQMLQQQALRSQPGDSALYEGEGQLPEMPVINSRSQVKIGQYNDDDSD